MMIKEQYGNMKSLLEGVPFFLSLFICKKKKVKIGGDKKKK